MTSNIRRFTTTTAMLLVMTGASVAADFQEKFEGAKPAVSAINGKLDLGYFYQDLEPTAFHVDGGYGIASISAPLGQSFGVQLDAGFMRLNPSIPAVDDLDAAGAALHAFWRNPDQGLVGFYGQYTRFSGTGGPDIDALRYGIEGEAYLGRVSLEAFVGADTVDSGPLNNTLFAGELKAAYYVTDNIRLEAGVLHQFDETFGRIGFEAALPVLSSRAAIYSLATFGDDATSVRAGLRFYFGAADKSLMARHREDDPAARLLDYFDIGGIGRSLGAVPDGGGEEGPCESCEAT